MADPDIEDDNLQDPFVEYDDRKLILSKMYESIEWLHNKANNGRITNKDVGIIKARVSVFKTLAYMCSVYNQIQKDTEIDELNEKLENLINEIKYLKGEKTNE